LKKKIRGKRRRQRPLRQAGGLWGIKKWSLKTYYTEILGCVPTTTRGDRYSLKKKKKRKTRRHKDNRGVNLRKKDGPKKNKQQNIEKVAQWSREEANQAREKKRSPQDRRDPKRGWGRGSWGGRKLRLQQFRGNFAKNATGVQGKGWDQTNQATDERKPPSVKKHHTNQKKIKIQWSKKGKRKKPCVQRRSMIGPLANKRGNGGRPRPAKL